MRKMLRATRIIVPLALTAALAIPVTAQRDWGRPDASHRQVRGDENSQAYQEGYRDGARDVQDHKSFHPEDKKWKSDTDRMNYRAGYQMGFNQGVAATEGRYGDHDRDDHDRSRDHDRSGNYGHGAEGYGYGCPANDLVREAQQTGYTDGVYYAQRDMQNHRRPDPTAAKGYKDADHNYSSSLGSKDEFQRIYRQAFLEGYQRTYR